MHTLKTKAAIKAVIFDCDGTLVDSEVLGAKAMHEVAVSYGCTLPLDDFIHSFVGRTMALNIETLNQHSSSPMPTSFAAEVRAAMAVKFQQELKEVDGAKALLQALQSRGIPVAVATNGPRIKAELTLELTGLLPYFQNPDTLFSAYEHDTVKPDPTLFLLAAECLNVDPKNCAAVEDSWSGLKAAVDAGMQTFSVVPLSHFKERFEPRPTELACLLYLLAYLPT